jgi:hypothetical protein
LDEIGLSLSLFDELPAQSSSTSAGLILPRFERFEFLLLLLSPAHEPESSPAF